MTHSRLSALGLVLAVVLCFQTTRAQQTNPPDNDQKAAEQALRDKAFKLLESLADQLGSLQSAENRARIGSNIAESIWSHDEARARNLFRQATEDIKLGVQQSKDDRQFPQTFAVFQKLHEDNVERIAKHDPELALTVLKETFSMVEEAARRPDGKVPPDVLRQEQDLELRLAQRIGARNVEVSVQLARQALEHGLDEQLLMLLIRISAKNREQAQSLYKDIVRKVAENDFNQSYPVLDFVTQLVEIFTPPLADESTYRELIGIVLNKAIAKGCARAPVPNDEEQENMCAYIGRVLPLMEKFYPAQARRLSRWALEDHEYRSDIPGQSYSEAQSYSELNYVSTNGTVDEILALRSKYPALSDDILMRAISKADREGDFERAKKLAGSYQGSNPDLQRSLHARLEIYNMSEEQVEQIWARAEKRVDSLPPSEQAIELVGTAMYVAPISKKVALKALNRASRMTETISAGERQTQFQIFLAMGYSLVKDDRAFAIMESLVPKLNELVAAAAKLDGFDTRYLRDGEWNMSASGSVGKVLTELAHGASYFAWYDFDRAVSLAAQFDRSEIRMMAQLKLAQGILAGRPGTFVGSPSF